MKIIAVILLPIFILNNFLLLVEISKIIKKSVPQSQHEIISTGSLKRFMIFYVFKRFMY